MHADKCAPLSAGSSVMPCCSLRSATRLAEHILLAALCRCASCYPASRIGLLCHRTRLQSTSRWVEENVEMVRRMQATARLIHYIHSIPAIYRFCIASAGVPNKIHRGVAQGAQLLCGGQQEAQVIDCCSGTRAAA